MTGTLFRLVFLYNVFVWTKDCQKIPRFKFDLVSDYMKTVCEGTRVCHRFKIQILNLCRAHMAVPLRGIAKTLSGILHSSRAQPHQQYCIQSSNSFAEKVASLQNRCIKYEKTYLIGIYRDITCCDGRNRVSVEKKDRQVYVNRNGSIHQQERGGDRHRYSYLTLDCFYKHIP